MNRLAIIIGGSCDANGNLTLPNISVTKAQFAAFSAVLKASAGSPQWEIDDASKQPIGFAGGSRVLIGTMYTDPGASIILRVTGAGPNATINGGLYGFSAETPEQLPALGLTGSGAGAAPFTGGTYTLTADATGLAQAQSAGADWGVPTSYGLVAVQWTLSGTPGGLSITGDQSGTVYINTIVASPGRAPTYLTGTVYLTAGDSSVSVAVQALASVKATLTAQFVPATAALATSGPGQALSTAAVGLPYGKFGHYRTTARFVLVATQAAGIRLFEMRNQLSTAVVVLTRLKIQWLPTSAHTAAIEDSLDMFTVSGFSAVDTTNTQTPVGIAKRSSMSPAPSAAVFRAVAAAGAAAGMTGGTISSTSAAPVAQLPQWLLAAEPTTVGVPPATLDAMADTLGTYPFVFALNEGFIITNRVLLGAAAGSSVYIDCEYAELVSY